MTLTAAHLKRVIERYHAALEAHRDTLNRLNVYPVPDGDTGTNMALTVGSVIEACREAESMREVTDAIAHGSLMGARGNSGVILSQILRGLSETFGQYDGVDPAAFEVALDRASSAAYESVVRPVEGTILTVVREAATAAREFAASATDDLVRLVERVYARALEALESTPEHLPVLKQAGVVDAGGAGLLLLIGAFVEELTGASRGLPDAITAGADAREDVAASDRPSVAELRYEVMYFLECADDAIAEFRTRWADIGDSIVVVGGDGTYNCHIHTDDIGGAVEVGVETGRPFQIRVTDLMEQSGLMADHGAPPPFEPLPAFADASVGVVAVAAGEGVVGMFRELGAQAVVAGGQTMNPSTEDLLAAVDRAAASSVVILPNNKNIVPVANQISSLTDKHVHVVATTSIPAGIAAMLAYAPEGAATDVAAAMAGAARDVVSGELTRATRDAETPVGAVGEGQWLVIVDGEIIGAEDEPSTGLMLMVEHALSPGAELITLILGDGHDPAVVAGFASAVKTLGSVEVETVPGGQPVYPYIVSIE